MKQSLWKFCCIASIIILLSSCQKEELGTDFIIAGNLSQSGIKFTDLVPNVRINDPENTSYEQIYQIDIDEDGQEDLEFVYRFSSTHIEIKVENIGIDVEYAIAVNAENEAVLFNRDERITNDKKYNGQDVALYEAIRCDRNFCPDTPPINPDVFSDEKFIGLVNEKGELGWVRLGSSPYEILEIYDYAMIVRK